VRINGLAITELDERSRTLLPRSHRLCLPILQPYSHTHRAGECDPAAKSSLGDPKVAQQSALKLLEQVELADRLPFLTNFQEATAAGCYCPCPAHDPKLVLADEPTGNLDETGQRVLQLLLKLDSEYAQNFDCGNTTYRSLNSPIRSGWDGRLTRVVHPDTIEEVAA